ncbi:MAG: hypothetical protein ABI886_12010 [Betaproteobacteria bacterium]
MRRPPLVTILALIAALAVSVGEARAQASAASVDPDCSSYPCGRVESIRQTMVKQTWTPLGANAGYGGGVTGGDAGTVTSAFKIGPGLSNQGMVLLGAAGGAEYKKTPNSYDQPQWEVRVKLDTGRTRTVVMRFEPFVREGDRVRVVGSNVELL